MAECEEQAALLQRAVGSYQDETFVDCALSTATTSPTTTATTSQTTTVTSSPTTTDTTTPTTTGPKGRFECYNFDASDKDYIEVPQGESCEAQAALLDTLLDACPGDTADYACEFGKSISRKLKVPTVCPVVIQVEPRKLIFRSLIL